MIQVSKSVVQIQFQDRLYLLESLGGPCQNNAIYALSDSREWIGKIRFGNNQIHGYYFCGWILSTIKKQPSQLVTSNIFFDFIFEKVDNI